MKKYTVIVLLALLLVGCRTSESAVQTAIAELKALTRERENLDILK